MQTSANCVQRQQINRSPSVAIHAWPSQQHIRNGEMHHEKYLRLGTLTILSASTPFIAPWKQQVGSSILVGTAYIYPYSFSVNGSSTLTEMMCMDDNREVTTGESWQADPSVVTKNSSKTDRAYLTPQTRRPRKTRS